MKVLLTCSNRHPGVKRHLIQLNNVFQNKTIFAPVEELFSLLPDYRRIKKGLPGIKNALRKIVKVKVSKKILDFGDNIIMGSWIPIYSDIINILNKKGIKPSILWCSTLGQSEMTWKIELEPFNKILGLLKKGKIKYLLVPEKTYESLSHIKSVKYLPHPIDLSIPMSDNDVELNGKNVDLFFKFRPGKNALQQMLSQRFTTTKFNLHTNIKDNTILDIAKNLNIHLTHHSWLPDRQYYALIEAMDVSLQVTWTESFNYAVCERMILGVPTLVSPEIFLISNDNLLRKYLTVETPDSPRAIAKKIDFLINNKNLRSEIAKKAEERVEEIAHRYNREIKEQLYNLFGL